MTTRINEKRRNCSTLFRFSSKVNLVSTIQSKFNTSNKLFIHLSRFLLHLGRWNLFFFRLFRCSTVSSLVVHSWTAAKKISSNVLLRSSQANNRLDSIHQRYVKFLLISDHVKKQRERRSDNEQMFEVWGDSIDADVKFTVNGAVQAENELLEAGKCLLRLSLRAAHRFMIQFLCLGLMLSRKRSTNCQQTPKVVSNIFHSTPSLQDQPLSHRNCGMESKSDFLIATKRDSINRDKFFEWLQQRKFSLYDFSVLPVTREVNNS